MADLKKYTGAIKSDYSVRFKIVIALVTLISFHSVVKESIEEFNFSKSNKNSKVVEYEQAYSRLKNFLPPHEIIGYVTDGPLDAEALYLSQYTLSPAVIVNNAKPYFLIANFYNPAEIEKFAEKQNLVIVHRANKHIFLLKKSIQ